MQCIFEIICYFLKERKVSRNFGGKSICRSLRPRRTGAPGRRSPGQGPPHQPAASKAQESHREIASSSNRFVMRIGSLFPLKLLSPIPKLVLTCRLNMPFCRCRCSCMCVISLFYSRKHYLFDDGRRRGAERHKSDSARRSSRSSSSSASEVPSPQDTLVGVRRRLGGAAASAAAVVKWEMERQQRRGHRQKSGRG